MPKFYLAIVAAISNKMKNWQFIEVPRFFIFVFVTSTFLLLHAVSAFANINSDLRIAAGLGNLSEVKKLLQRGADPNSGGPSAGNVPAGVTALMLAATQNHKDIVDVLLAHGANPNQSDNGGATAMIYASWKGNTDIVKLLLKSGADPNAATRDGRTALSVARQAGHTAIVNLLQQYGTKR